LGTSSAHFLSTKKDATRKSKFYLPKRQVLKSIPFVV